jgi:subtilisin family serine protease
MATGGPPPDPQITGRSVVVFSDAVRGDRAAIEQALRSLADIASVVATSDFDDGALGGERTANAEAILFDALGLAVVSRGPDELAASLSRMSASDASIVTVEPERVMHAIADPPADPDPSAEPAATFTDDDAFTWGLHATAVDATSATGAGRKIAVLDTGFDLAHPDFAGRAITSQSFVDGAAVDDGHGHGTHTAGTAAGPAKPGEGRRYGVAPEAQLFVGKVLDDSGAGVDAGILAGIDWAITNGCQVISMSLGADVATVSTAYETVGRRALDAGCVIVAAAGNNANRSNGDPGFVGMPANSPSIMAIAALDSQLRVADFSAAANPVEGGEIDVAAPGVDVYSSWPMPQRYDTISGTSMATPHVAGLAALWSQTTGATGQALWTKLTEAARSLGLPATDVGAGLAQAPPPASD